MWFQNRRAKWRRNERSAKGGSSSPFPTQTPNNSASGHQGQGLMTGEVNVNTTAGRGRRALSPMSVSMSLNLTQRNGGRVASPPQPLIPSQFAPPNVVVQNSVFPPQPAVNPYGGGGGMQMGMGYSPVAEENSAAAAATNHHHSNLWANYYYYHYWWGVRWV